MVFLKAKWRVEIMAEEKAVKMEWKKVEQLAALRALLMVDLKV